MVKTIRKKINWMAGSWRSSGDGALQVKQIALLRGTSEIKSGIAVFLGNDAGKRKMKPKPLSWKTYTASSFSSCILCPLFFFARSSFLSAFWFQFRCYLFSFDIFFGMWFLSVIRNEAKNKTKIHEDSSDQTTAFSSLSFPFLSFLSSLPFLSLSFSFSFSFSVSFPFPLTFPFLFPDQVPFLSAFLSPFFFFPVLFLFLCFPISFPFVLPFPVPFLFLSSFSFLETKPVNQKRSQSHYSIKSNKKLTVVQSVGSKAH